MLRNIGFFREVFKEINFKRDKWGFIVWGVFEEERWEGGKVCRWLRGKVREFVYDVVRV